MGSRGVSVVRAVFVGLVVGFVRVLVSALSVALSWLCLWVVGFVIGLVYSFDEARRLSIREAVIGRDGCFAARHFRVKGSARVIPGRLRNTLAPGLHGSRELMDLFDEPVRIRNCVDDVGVGDGVGIRDSVGLHHNVGAHDGVAVWVRVWVTATVSIGAVGATRGIVTATPPTAARATVPSSILARNPDDSNPNIAARRVTRFGPPDDRSSPHRAQRETPSMRTAASALQLLHRSGLFRVMSPC